MVRLGGNLMVLSVMRQHGLWAAVSVFLLLVITGKNASAKADIILNNTAIYDNSACLTLVGKLDTIDSPVRFERWTITCMRCVMMQVDVSL